MTANESEYAFGTVWCSRKCGYTTVVKDSRGKEFVSCTFRLGKLCKLSSSEDIQRAKVCSLAQSSNPKSGKRIVKSNRS